MKQVIEIIIAPNGDAQIDAVGFKGVDCETATRYLEEALGLVNNRAKKPEYHQSRNARRQQQVGQ